jgi:hypothetical protein
MNVLIFNLSISSKGMVEVYGDRVEVLENLELVRVGMEQLHDNGGAVRLCGVSHGRLRLHIQYPINSSQRTVCLVALPGSAAPNHLRLHRSTPRCTPRE